MKRILVLVLMYLPFTAIYGQKSPCDIKKQDWVTAASNEEGNVQFYLETSSCNGSDMCGNPKVVLKHTFNGPTWFKIKLSGYDCAGNLLENDFATGARPIEPNKEFASVQNWHVFKTLVKILKVEVSVDKVVSKTLTFNDMKNVEVSTATPPPSVADKPAAIETKPVVAAASTPSVEKVETVEKPVVAAASTPSVKTAKTVEEPVVAAASTPSVETVKTVEKPTEKPVVVQTVEKKRSSEPQKTNTDGAKAEPIATTPEVNTQTINPVRKRLNVLKTNILYPIALGYERHIAKNFSVVLNGFYLPSVSYGSASGKLGYLGLTEASSGFSAEGRYYTSRTKARLNGLYVGGFYSVRSASVLMRKIETSANQTLDVSITLPTGIGTMGLMVGKQKIRTKGFTTDMSFGVGYFEAFNIPQISSDATSTLSRLSSLSKYSKGIAPRLTLSLGYAF